MAAKFKIVQRKEACFKISQRAVSPEPKEVRDDYPKLESTPKQKLMRFDAQIDIGTAEGKKFDTIKDGDKIVDYQNVVVRGYLSTFGNKDRDGETVRPGAFKDTIGDFMRNPVMLADHTNKTQTLVGSFTTVKEDSKGLYVEGLLSNSPTEYMRHIRALVAEGHLKTMSMGGLFFVEGDEIFKVSLFEGSLVPIPANPQAIISVRECTEHEAKRWQFDERNPAE
jgi:HK97 family phage prohead protease